MLVLQMVWSFVGTLMFSSLFNVQRKYYLGCGFAGMAGWICYYLTQDYFQAPMRCFFSSIVIVLCSRLLARKMKCPITVFLISGIFPLVPGVGVYKTVYYLVTDQGSLAATAGLDALKVAFGIVLGIVFTLSIPTRWFQLSYQKNKKKNGS